MQEELVQGKVGATYTELHKKADDVLNKGVFGVSGTKLMKGLAVGLGVAAVIFIIFSHLCIKYLVEGTPVKSGYGFGMGASFVVFIFVGIIIVYVRKQLRGSFTKEVLGNINNHLGSGVIKPNWINQETFYNKVLEVISAEGKVNRDELHELSLIIDAATCIHNKLDKDGVLVDSLDNIEWTVDTDAIKVRLYNKFGESYSHVVEFPKNVELN